MYNLILLLSKPYSFLLLLLPTLVLLILYPGQLQEGVTLEQVRALQFQLPACGECDRAVSVPGNVGKLRNRLQLAEAEGRPFNVALIGGSVSTGIHVTNETFYGSYFVKQLSAYLRRPVNLWNAAYSATGSEYYANCYEPHFDLPKVDLVLAEFALNDERFGWMPGYSEQSRPLSQLLSRLQHQQAQTILVNFRQLKNLLQENGLVNCSSVGLAVADKLARQFDVPSLSWLRPRCLTKMTNEEIAPLKAEDGVHPSRVIHLQMASYLLHFVVNSILKPAQNYPRPRYTVLDTSSPISAPRCYMNVRRAHRRTYELLSRVTANVSTSLVESQVSLNDDDYESVLFLQGAAASLTLDLQVPQKPEGDIRDTVLRVALLYYICKECSPENLHVTITTSAGPEEHTGGLLLGAHNIAESNFVQELTYFPPIRDVTSRVSMELTMTTGAYEFYLNAVVLEWVRVTVPR